MKIIRSLTLAMLTLGIVVSSAQADAMSDLKSRFEARLPALRALKDAGRVGETAVGQIEAVRGGLDDTSAGLVQDENADRAELYKLIAAKEGATVPVVAERNALRNFKNAQAGDWLKFRDGSWKQK